MSGFNSAYGGNFDQYFMTTTDLIDRYATGGLWGWGLDTSGQLGDSTVTNKSSPVQTITLGTNWSQISGGGVSSAAIKTDGTLWTWGSNFYGQLGNSTSTNRSSPVQTIALGNNWKQISIMSHCSAVKTDGTLWLWGYDGYGELGTSVVNITLRSSPVQTIALGNNWKQTSCGQTTTGAIKTDGTLWMWGYNIYGALGDSTTIKRSSPVQTIALGTDWKQISLGNQNCIALKTNGTLWTWGLNSSGQLGDSTTINRSSPVQTIALGNNWKQVSAGSNGGHFSAIKTDGTLWCWGNNGYGQLGESTTSNRSSPVQTIALGTNWRLTSTLNDNIAAIKTDGTLWIWGSNVFGQLGDNTASTTVSMRSSPVQTIALGNNWKQIAGSQFVLVTQYSDIGQVL